jgi:hypothetical protein
MAALSTTSSCVWHYRDADAIEVLRPRGGHHPAALGRLRETTRLPAAHLTRVAGFSDHHPGGGRASIWPAIRIPT